MVNGEIELPRENDNPNVPGNAAVPPPIANMNFGEFVTRASVWMALAAYATAASIMLRRSGRGGVSHPGSARTIWTAGCGFFLVHVACAFTFFHGWSHAAAYDETSRQTAEMTGLHWGGGLYFNYLFAALWVLDAAWMWLSPKGRTCRPGWVAFAWHGFAFFMIFNGAVVFAHGPVRWLGLAICALLAGLGWRKWRRRDLAVIPRDR